MIRLVLRIFLCFWSDGVFLASNGCLFDRFCRRRLECVKEQARDHYRVVNPNPELGQHYSRYLFLGELFQYPILPLPPVHYTLSFRTPFYDMVLGPDDSGAFLRPPTPANPLSGATANTDYASPGPQYLSSRSSDVILSDIRPIQLKAEALRSINTFLDEFLWNILSTARSLVTDRIKAGVLKILPTSLGKAALLEAEVELKAYWERTGPTPNLNLGATDALDFPLQWSYEVPRFSGVSLCYGY